MRYLVWLWMAVAPLAVPAADYFIDSTAGRDSHTGLSEAEAWQSLEKVNSSVFQPGDRVLFRAGGFWSGQLAIAAQGEAERPIVFASYGSGARPRIDADGRFDDAVLIRNVNHVEVRGFEITNRGEGEASRRGVHILAENCGTLSGIIVSDLFIHDVNGSLDKKDTGGIIFRTRGDKVPSRFDGLRIERNIVWKVDRSGIAAQSFHWPRKRWFPSLHVVIRDNWVGDAGGDGIVPWATDGVLVEHNIVQGANERADSYNAGIWPWSADNSVFRLNRASGVKTLKDGQGFDSDYNSRNTLFEYNLSHDNEGGFFLICTPGDQDPNENLGNLGTVVRRNISRYDKNRVFHVSAAKDTLVHENAIYVGKDQTVQMLVLTDWKGWADGLEFRHNLLHTEGEAEYGHEISRGKDGSYEIGPGWGPAKGVVFRGNRYEGRHTHRPEDRESFDEAPKPIEMDWPGPQFDPNRPETFPAYIQDHRAWMLDVMERQFGSRPNLGE